MLTGLCREKTRQAGASASQPGPAVWLWEPTLSEIPGPSPPHSSLRFLLGFIRTESFHPHSWVQIPSVPRRPGTPFLLKGETEAGSSAAGSPGVAFSSGFEFWLRDLE